MNRKFIDYLKNNKLIVKLYSEMMNRIQTMNVVTEIAETRPILYRPLSVPMEHNRLNLVIPSLTPKDVYGGIATAFYFYQELCEKLDCDCRIIVLDAAVDLNNIVALDGYQLVDWNEDCLSERQIVDFSSRMKKTLAVGDKDIFMATIWWSAYILEPIMKWQSDYYNEKERKLIYLIQDYEPGFYPWSSKYLMADSTYRMNINTMAIFNSKLLCDYFKQQGYEFYKSWYFEPVLNEKLKEYLKNVKELPERKNQILIYGRPGTARNAFELILSALREWTQIQDDAKDWCVVAAGEKFDEIEIADGVKLKSLGKLTLDEYAQIMLESKIGISLMVSPHPSYPPLEMSTFGMKVITNTYGNKDLKDFNENIFSIDNCSAKNIANELKKLCSNKGNSEIKTDTDYYNSLQDWTLIKNEIYNELIENE